MNTNLTAALVSAVIMLRRHAIRATLLSLQFFVSASVLLVVTASTLGTVRDVRLLSAVFDRTTVGIWQTSGPFVSQSLPLNERDLGSIGLSEGVEAVAGCSESWVGLADLTELDGALDGTVLGTYEPSPTSEQGLPVYGVTHDFASFFGLRVEKGRWLSAEECEQGTPVAVITEELAFELTGGRTDSAELVGEVLALGHRLLEPVKVRVVGVLEGRSPIPGSPHPVADPQVRVGEALAIVPNRLSGFRGGSRSGDSLDSIWVRFSPFGADTDGMAKALVGQLSALHGAAFEYSWKAKQVEDEWNLLRPILLALGAFGLGALILASFGLAGLSLITVAQRRREVGLRQALGATRTDVAAQFFLETVLPAMLGTFLSLVGVMSAGGGLEKSLRLVLTPVVIISTLAVVLGSCFLPGLLAVRRTTTMAPWDLLRGS